ncbi:hypothetical protein HanXRQr2_Chr16g0740971 [Helianthus annuus]|uniref:Uncharacterized protein n=1 Tax=Helianthus annuus TaxID=4232 RepID=A0A9K3GZM9_HELAN|nr:hypothetical protein HanXRQr2_Chr16g0740971 [Helianthus annuus]KAJ0820662.1 hypothetical protein HanPSC8_Chr16g0710661 [Helianthus annuus]
MQNPTEVSSFHQPYITNWIKEHSRAPNFMWRYLLQFLTFSGFQS